MFNLQSAKNALISLVTVWGNEPEVNENDTIEFWQVDMIKERLTEQDCASFFDKWSGIVENLSVELCEFYEGVLVS